MKHLILAASLLLAANVVQAQISLEHRYPLSLEPFKLSTGDVKFAGASNNGQQVVIYNSNHSLYRQVTLGLPAGSSSVYDVNSLSDKLFDATSTLEFVVTYSNNTTNVYTTRVYNEAGAVVLNVDSCNFAQPYNLPTGTKLFCFGSSGNARFTKIYTLPGTLVTLRAASSSTGLESTAYPNPTTGMIVLPYELQSGQIATLEIMDMTGRIVKSYNVGSAFKDLLVQAGELRSGSYVYRLVTSTGPTVGKKFTVQ